MSKNTPSTIKQTSLGDLEKVFIQGDLSKLSEKERIEYYMRVCESLELNPLTKPFEYFEANGKLILGARKGCSEQLRNIHQVTVSELRSEEKNGLYIVWASAELPSGRKDVASGIVAIEGLKGKNLANALMTAETKAKNRVTLSLFGLGMLDETEFETIATPPKEKRAAITIATPQKTVTLKEAKNIEEIVPSSESDYDYLDADPSLNLPIEDYVLTTGKYKGKTLAQAAINDIDPTVWPEFIKWVNKFGDDGLKQIPQKDMIAINHFLKP
jgi:hypothetical protein